MTQQDYEDCARATERAINEVGIAYLSPYGLLSYCEWQPTWVEPVPRRKVCKGSRTIGERLGI